MPKKTEISQEDKDAFYDAVKGTKPLIHKKERITPTPPKPSHTRPRKTHLDEDDFHVNESADTHDVRSEEFITFKQAGISNKTLRKLRKGQYNVEAILDLHGKSAEEAKFAVEKFLQQCLDRDLRVVLIIHGKSRHSEMPILKNKLNHWLRGINQVLAFCSASPLHGSRGAIYILLKRNVEEDTVE